MVKSDVNALKVAVGCQDRPAPGAAPRPGRLAWGPMCRNITELRGLEPPATDAEIEAAARQFIRKITGLRQPPPGVAEAYEAAIVDVTTVTQRLLDQLPARRQPPATVPPLRRPEVQARLQRAAKG
jgi:hypothetical protein